MLTPFNSKIAQFLNMFGYITYNKITMKTPKTTPVKNMPTHGPGTYAFYKGSKCKILSIGEGKAKIMVNGQIKLVNYTSLDDEMYGTGINLPINESEKQDAYQEFFKNKLKDYGVESPSELSVEDKSKFFSEIKSEWKGGSVNESLSKNHICQFRDKYGDWYFVPNSVK